MSEAPKMESIVQFLYEFLLVNSHLFF